MRRILRNSVTIIALAALVTLPALAEDDDNLRNYLELVRSDLSSAKKATINDVMQLTDAEAKIFWPIYREYELELGKIIDDRFELTKRFINATDEGEFAGKDADQIATGFFEILERRIGLWKKYHKRFKKELSPVRAGQFVQIENQIQLFVDLNIAAEMPIIQQLQDD